MMSAGDETIMADRLHAILTSERCATGRRHDRASDGYVRPLGRAHRIRRRASTHVLHLRQKGNELGGSHQGDFVSRDLTGTISGSDVRLRSNYGGDRRFAGVQLYGDGASDEMRAISTWESI